MRRVTLVSFVALLGCGAAPPPIATAPPVEAPPPPPLPRACQEALPLPHRTVGDLARLLARMPVPTTLTTHPCDKTTAWPVAFRNGDESRAPVGITVLQMEGDALLTFDAKDRESPTVKLCAQLEGTIGPRHRVRAIALWDSGDDAAFDAANLAGARAELAWLEVLSRTPSRCALGEREERPDGDPELSELLRCTPATLASAVPDDCGQRAVDADPPPQPEAGAVEAAAGKTHRFGFDGRPLVRDPDLRLERTERCFYEPPPATHDVCLAEYVSMRDPRERWYGRGDVARTGEDGEKNYVDSYLTFQQLKRLEGERRAQQKK